ncbi:MAG: alpha-glucuronidase [Christensenellales bacterium]
MQHNRSLAWMAFLGAQPVEGSSPEQIAAGELRLGRELLGLEMPLTLCPRGEGEGFAISREGAGYLVSGGPRGLLYGSYRLLMKLAAGLDPLCAMEEPACCLRMLDHWDNLDGTVERGYAGASLFFQDGGFRQDWPRLRQYARLLASVGINAVCLNNVNVRPPADRLITGEWLPGLARVADLLRPYGIRLLAAVDFALPHTLGLPTADPLDSGVQRWWGRQADEIYRHIPDFAGVLVKADSEFRPGPQSYGRSHAQGANMLADAFKPHGGQVVWRCFVYNCTQDWRDRGTDRPKAAYEQYAPLEGQFHENVILQIKQGPYDFQVREPVSPLFFALPGTHKALELQLAQEYTGQQIDLYYLPPQWEEVAGDLAGFWPRQISAVSNLGRDENWTGHDLAQANLFSYGLFAWRGRTEEADADWWIRLSYGRDPLLLSTLAAMLLRSRAVYESYTAPLSLGWMVRPHTHYGPDPEGYEYDRWGTYLRTDLEAVGVDRSSRGTGFTLQYPQPLRACYDDPATCPQELLLFFHRLRFDHLLPDGRSLIQYIYDSRFQGARDAEGLLLDWLKLEGLIAEEGFRHTLARFQRQAENAREWRDVLNNYFHRFSGVEDGQGRLIP